MLHHAALAHLLQVANLRQRLVKIIADFRTHMSLQQGCNTCLRHDCIVLANRLYRWVGGGGGAAGRGGGRWGQCWVVG